MNIPEVKNREEAENYLLSHNFEDIVIESEGSGTLGINAKLETRDPYKPDLVDLCRLHRFIIENKRTTILEFGTGWSTWILADALSKLKLKYLDEVSSLRRNNPFELHVVDDEPEYLKISAKRIPNQLKSIATFHQKSVTMGTFNDRICTYYESIPLISPDFIYIDGPDQFNVRSDVSGWSTRHKDMMPMCGDLLRIEHYLTPGTMIVFDGRAANARFFNSNMQRDWDYQYDSHHDQHIFVLHEAPLGKFNKQQLNWYTSK